MGDLPVKGDEDGEGDGQVGMIYKSDEQRSKALDECGVEWMRKQGKQHAEESAELE